MLNTQKIEKFNIIGIAVRTTNENGQAAIDIPKLWDRFTTEKIIDRIPNIVDHSVYSIYTDYEKDHTKPYTTILGCVVENLETIPQGMVGKTIEESTYVKRTVQGNLANDIVINEWNRIWSSDLDRAFTADFEIYGERAQDFKNAEVDIFIAIR